MIWFKTLRPRTTLMATLLCFIGFKVADIQIGATEWLIATFVFVVGGFTMVINDWQDRHVDNMAGRSFALENSLVFFKYVWLLCTASIMLATTLLLINKDYGLLSYALIAIGASYGIIRRFPLLPALYTAACSSLPIAYSYIHMNATNTVNLSYVVAGTMLLIYGRENFKDLEDIEQDKNTKWTIASNISANAAKVVVTLCYTGALAMYGLYTSAAYIAAPFVMLACVLMFTDMKKRIVKSVSDLAIIGLMLYLLLS